MITISVDSDEEQRAIGTALVNGALAFGNWPFEVKRRYRAAAGAEGDGGSAYAAGHGSLAIGGAGSGGVTIWGGSGAGGLSAGSGGGSAAGPDFFVCPLRACCATRTDGGHREGCDEDTGL